MTPDFDAGSPPRPEPARADRADGPTRGPAEVDDLSRIPDADEKPPADGPFRLALDEVRLYQLQSSRRFDIEPSSGARTIKLALEQPGLVGGVPGQGDRVSVRGRHEVLLVIPSAFPTQPPALIWRSPVWNPYLMQDALVWPPGFDWNHTPSLVRLIGAVADTLAGVRTDDRGRWYRRLPWRRSRYPEAASWYRKHRSAVDRLADPGGEPPPVGGAGLPFAAAASWYLVGAPAGGSPLVYVSRRFHDGVVAYAAHAPAWVPGRRGSKGATRWFFLDRIVPAFEGQVPSGDTVGAFQAAGPGTKLTVPPGFLNVVVRDGQPVFSTGPGDSDVDGYFVASPSTSLAPSPVQGEAEAELLPIKVGTPDPMEPERPWHAAQVLGLPSGLPPQEAVLRTSPDSAPVPVCAYCGESCGPDLEWGECVTCSSASHARCTDNLGGCSNIGCTRSAL